jgi:hypothetical protein
VLEERSSEVRVGMVEGMVEDIQVLEGMVEGMVEGKLDRNLALGIELDNLFVAHMVHDSLFGDHVRSGSVLGSVVPRTVLAVADSLVGLHSNYHDLFVDSQDKLAER